MSLSITADGWRARVRDYGLLMRLDKPIGVLLLLWPTLWAVWLAGDGHPSLKYIVVFVLGVEIMRAAGCIINDFADRRIDPYVQRTRQRPLATGRVSVAEAMTLFVALCLLAFALALQLNGLAIALSLPAVAVAVAYPFSKRVTYLPQAVLGVAFGWGIPMAFAAETGRVPLIAWILLVINIFWAMAYDTFYAMADRPDDLKIGVKSSAILFGRWDRAMTAAFQVVVLAGLWLVGRLEHLGLWFDLGLLAAAGCALYEQYLIRDREPAACFRAFLHNTWFGAAVFAGLVLSYWMGWPW